MSATLAPQTSPVPAAAPPALEMVPSARATTPAEAEMHRWLLFLGTSFVLGAVFFALSIGTSAHWLIGVSLVLGPVLFLISTVYLCISSDSNGAFEPTSAVEQPDASPLRAAA
jgi:hypothetical protein